ncbi:hypothetical protein RRG08_029833 [Elysia crispata]|uniref:Uncharacterized protein n=1 Tax=Elysia crispata TaxID=231223 RepID=A0AAE1D152_9GAST|nr:hypothetical protein RRG08_029833 [Elysia crispata]
MYVNGSRPLFGPFCVGTVSVRLCSSWTQNTGDPRVIPGPVEDSIRHHIDLRCVSDYRVVFAASRHCHGRYCGMSGQTPLLVGSSSIGLMKHAVLLAMLPRQYQTQHRSRRRVNPLTRLNRITSPWSQEACLSQCVSPVLLNIQITRRIVRTDRGDAAFH